MLGKHYCYFCSTRVAGALRKMGGGGVYLSLELRELALGHSGKHTYLLGPHICEEGKRKTY